MTDTLPMTPEEKKQALLIQLIKLQKQRRTVEFPSTRYWVIEQMIKATEKVLVDLENPKVTPDA